MLSIRETQQEEGPGYRGAVTVNNIFLGSLIEKTALGREATCWCLVANLCQTLLVTR